MDAKAPGLNTRNPSSSAQLLATRLPECSPEQAVLKALHSSKVKGSKVQLGM